MCWRLPTSAPCSSARRASRPSRISRPDGSGGSLRANATTRRPNWRWRGSSPGRGCRQILDFGFSICDWGKDARGSGVARCATYGAHHGRTPRRRGRIGAGGRARLAAKAVRFWIFDFRFAIGGRTRGKPASRGARLRGSNATTRRPNWRWRGSSPGREGCKILDFQIIDAAHARRQGLSRRRRGGDLAAAGHRGHRQKDHRKNPDRRQQCASTEAHRVLSRPAMPVVRDYTVRG